MVRPKKSDADRKDEQIRIRMTAEEKALMVAAAERAGEDVSSWLRRLALEAARPTAD